MAGKLMDTLHLSFSTQDSDEIELLYILSQIGMKALSEGLLLVKGFLKGDLIFLSGVSRDKLTLFQKIIP